MSKSETAGTSKAQTAAEPNKPDPAATADQPTGEVGGPKGPEPTRYGDWAFNGRVSDF